MKDIKVINKFYKCWINKDIKGLKKIYHDDVIFTDEFFKNLDYNKVTSMWEMLFSRSKNKNDATFEVLKENDGIFECKLTVNYTINDNDVTNVIYDTFEIEDNKIITHNAKFDQDKWFDQAFADKKKLSKSKVFRKVVILGLNRKFKKYLKENK